MTTSSLMPVVQADLRIDITPEARPLVVRMSGTADLRTNAVLATFIAKLQFEARRAHVTEVVVDRNALAFMSSACIKVFVTWLDQVRQLAEPERYKVRFVANRREHHWQGRTLEALAGLAPDVVVLEPG